MNNPTPVVTAVFPLPFQCWVLSLLHDVSSLLTVSPHYLYIRSHVHCVPNRQCKKDTSYFLEMVTVCEVKRLRMDCLLRNIIYLTCKKGTAKADRIMILCGKLTVKWTFNLSGVVGSVGSWHSPHNLLSSDQCCVTCRRAEWALTWQR